MVDVDGSGTTLVSGGSLFVGFAGEGTLMISGGAAVISTDGYVGYTDTGFGEVVVVDEGSTWTNVESLEVGVEGTGHLTVATGGRVTAPQLTIGASGQVSGDGVLEGEVYNSFTVFSKDLDDEKTKPDNMCEICGKSLMKTADLEWQYSKSQSFKTILLLRNYRCQIIKVALVQNSH